MKKYYKAWIEIERIDENGDGEQVEGILPDSVGASSTLSGIKARVWQIVQRYCPDPQNSDCNPQRKKRRKPA